MDKLDLFKKAGVVAIKFIEGISDDQWDKISVDDPWTVKDLVNHLTYEMLWIPSLVTEGKTVAEVGDKFEGDVVGKDPVDAFKEALMAAQRAFSASGVMEKEVHLSYGDFPAEYYCGHTLEELAIHGWDVAVSTSQKEDLPEELVDAVWKIVKPELEDWRKAGALGKKIEVSDDADSQTKLLAELGRDRSKFVEA